MNELALFAGAGGGILGSHLLGWQTVAACEIEEYPRAVLLQRQLDGLLPKFPIWDDICTFDGKQFRGKIDVVTGGFPCQAWSTACHGQHTAENLWPEMLRVVGEVSPRYVFGENVDEGAIVQAQKDLVDCGYYTQRAMVAGYHVGADHPRERWWLFADSDHKGELGGKQYAEVAIEQEGKKTVWKTDPKIARMDDGYAGRVDRYKCIGNAQCPQAMALAFRILSGEIK